MARRAVVVVGGGIVGLATARELLRRHPGLELVLLEKELDIARHQTGHNSGVVHSGVYYAPGSLRARACVEGGRLLAEFCSEHGVPLLRRGKLIVATRAAELPRLAELSRRAEANGVAAHLLDPAGMREIEPHVAGLRALHVPGTAAVDFVRVARALADEIAGLGGVIRCGVRVTRLAVHGTAAVAHTDQGDFTAGAAVACAGLQSDRLAGEVDPDGPRIVPFRGDFWMLRPERASLVRGMIYPVPDPALPFLGVHATRRVDDAVWLGPNAVPALAREAYRPGAVDRGDVADLVRDARALRLMARHWRSGLVEIARELVPGLLVRALQRYLPDLRREDVQPGPCGVRAQAVTADGRMVDDFVVTTQGRVVHVRNAPSPAATASLAIARMVADAVEVRL